MYKQTTKDITVSVEPVYLEEESSPGNNRYFWAYHILIQNNGSESVQLHKRFWQITDSAGLTQEISGEGVIGEQPFVEPGKSYAYTSGAPLNTPGGMMVGNYTMKNGEGEMFTVDIPAFSLDSPHQNAIMH
ncbi:MAG: protein ApaG [Micavibrio sp.]|nr:MAG: protein ApaG [Micavibrio sp.]